MEWLREFNLYTVLIRLALAFILAGIVGFEREKKGHAAGLRTHILVCMGAALTTLTGVFCTEVLGYSTDPMRIGAQVVSGIGFIGAGTIMVTRGTHVKGLTTAAGLWSTAAIGLCVGAGFYEGALICTLFIAIAITSLKPIDRLIYRKKYRFELYIEVRGTCNVNPVLDKITASGVTVYDTDITPPRSANPQNAGISMGVLIPKRSQMTEQKLKALIIETDCVDILLINA